MLRKPLTVVLVVTFLTSCLGPIPKAHAGPLSLPAPGAMVNLSPAFEPVLIKGIKVHPENPFAFDFIVDTGNEHFSGDLSSRDSGIRDQAGKLIKYFLASLTIPEKDLWVNLSPYEKDRMIADNLGNTQMGQDMLAQDYILKQLTASLIYPERDLGKAFWDKVYQKAQQLYGTTEIPVNTFNKVWIVADKADVFERGNVAYIVGAHLKVMLEEDYTALAKHQTPTRGHVPRSQAGYVSPSTLPSKQTPEGESTPGQPPSASPATNALASQIVRDVILPSIEQEVNTGKNFAPLRQMFYSMILASWYKMALKDTILTQLYGNQSKTKVGINANDPTDKDKIFEQYLKAYKKGVFNYIKEDIDAAKGQAVPRKYFSGGLEVFPGGDPAQLIRRHQPWKEESVTGNIFDAAVLVNIPPAKDAAMNAKNQDEIWQSVSEAVDKLKNAPSKFRMIRLPTGLLSDVNEELGGNEEVGGFGQYGGHVYSGDSLKDLRELQKEEFEFSCVRRDGNMEILRIKALDLEKMIDDIVLYNMRSGKGFIELLEKKAKDAGKIQNIFLSDNMDFKEALETIYTDLNEASPLEFKKQLLEELKHYISNQPNPNNRELNDFVAKIFKDAVSLYKQGVNSNYQFISGLIDTRRFRIGGGYGADIRVYDWSSLNKYNDLLKTERNWPQILASSTIESLKPSQADDLSGLLKMDFDTAREAIKKAVQDRLTDWEAMFGVAVSLKSYIASRPYSDFDPALREDFEDFVINVLDDAFMLYAKKTNEAKNAADMIYDFVKTLNPNIIKIEAQNGEKILLDYHFYRHLEKVNWKKARNKLRIAMDTIMIIKSKANQNSPRFDAIPMEDQMLSLRVRASKVVDRLIKAPSNFRMIPLPPGLFLEVRGPVEDYHGGFDFYGNISFYPPLEQLQQEEFEFSWSAQGAGMSFRITAENLKRMIDDIASKDKTAAGHLIDFLENAANDAAMTSQQPPAARADGAMATKVSIRDNSKLLRHDLANSPETVVHEILKPLDKSAEDVSTIELMLRTRGHDRTMHPLSMKQLNVEQNSHQYIPQGGVKIIFENKTWVHVALKNNNDLILEDSTPDQRIARKLLSAFMTRYNLSSVKLRVSAPNDAAMTSAPSRVDKAALAQQPPGGIDLNRAKMQMNIKRDPSSRIHGTQDDGSAFKLDPDVIEHIRRQGFDGLEFKIQAIVPVTDLPLLLGLSS